MKNIYYITLLILKKDGSTDFTATIKETDHDMDTVNGFTAELDELQNDYNTAQGHGSDKLMIQNWRKFTGVGDEDGS